jgi:conjugal transfer pilus assembly protein TraW
MGIDGLLLPIRCVISKRPEPRCLALVAAVLVFGGVSTGNHAEDLGTVGETYAIAEPHLLSYIEQTLRAKERSGELANLEQQAKSRVIESIRNPKPLVGIRATQTARTFYFDPSITVEQNITDDKGNIIVPAGTTKNPLEVVSLSKHLLFFDGSDPQQVRDARALIDHYGGKVKPILVAGSYLDLMKAWQLSVYFDQQGVLTSKFGITQVPALVSQEGMRLRIDEFKVRR